MDRDALLQLLLEAYPDRVTLRRTGDASRGLMVGGRGVVLEPGSSVRESLLFLSLDPREATWDNRTECRVSLASSIEEEWLEPAFPHLVARRLVHRYDAEKEKIASLRQVLFADIVLRESGADPRDDIEGASAALAEALGREATAWVSVDEAAAAWLARARFLARAMPDLDAPPFDEECLRACIADAAAGCTTAGQVRQRIRNVLEARLNPKQSSALQREAPEAIPVPSGNRIRLAYADGTPTLAVRLQELFGMPETPRIAGGRVPVLLHLLAPNYRPVQVTMDLRNFWNTTYAEVRREFRARYPKHPWPEDPWNAPAVSVGRRRH